MSQFYVGVSSGSLPPTVAQQFTTDDATIAVPAAGNINLFTNDTISDNDNGIRSTASGSTVTTQLTNRQTGTVTTANATLTTIQTISLGATPGTFYFFGNIQAFNASGPAGGTYSFSGGYRTNGITATELGTEFHDEFEDVVLVSSDIFLNTSGNNVLIQVQGVAATSINWSSVVEFRKVN